jgi:SSU ribosomal protein S18P
MNKCYFCLNKIEPSFKKPEVLERFLTPRKKIQARKISGLCAQHQRRLAKQIKHARFLALIPYVSYQGVK